MSQFDNTRFAHCLHPVSDLRHRDDGSQYCASCEWLKEIGGNAWPKGAGVGLRQHLAMICGVDCHPGDAVCNNYCNQSPQKGPMASKPPLGPDAPPPVVDRPEPVRICPENNWREVWHANCPKWREGYPKISHTSAPMKRHQQSEVIEDGSRLGLFECVVCGVKVYAGVDQSQRVVVRELPTASRAEARSDVASADPSAEELHINERHRMLRELFDAVARAMQEAVEDAVHRGDVGYFIEKFEGDKINAVLDQIEALDASAETA